MKNVNTGSDHVILTADTVAEAGMMFWLAARFKGQTVTLEFDTTTYGDVPQSPALWIKVAPQQDPMK